MNEFEFKNETQEESQIDVRLYLQIILKRKWTIIAAFIIVVLTVAINDFTQIPMFRADCRMVIEKSNPNVVSIQEVMAIDTWDPDYKKTQYSIIRSRSVARSVIARLSLAENEEFQPKSEGGFISNIRSSINNTLRSWKAAVVGLLKKEKKKIPEGLAPEEDEFADSGMVSSFVGRISVSPVEDSRLVDVGFVAYDPKMAVKIVNGLGQAYIDHNLDLRLGAIKNAMEWMNERIEEERLKVEAAERSLQQYRESEGIVTEFSGEIETVTAQKLAQLNTQVVQAESDRVEAETRYVQAVQMHDNPLVLDAIPEVLNNEIIKTIKKTEVDLYKRISDLSRKYGKEHPRMKAALSELEVLQERKNSEISKIIDSLKNEYQVAMARESSLVAALERQKEESLELNKKAIEYGVLKREAEGARELYDLLIRRFKETSVTEDIDTSNIRIIDRAEFAYKVSPNSQRNLKLAVVIGLMLGLGLAFLFEYLDNTIKTPGEVEQIMKVPYLGMIPLLDVNGTGSQANGKFSELVVISQPKTVASESYRSIRTRVVFSSPEHPPQTILITSSTGEEGKTITAANLAVTMAQTGSKVVMLDCDMRKPRLHHLFGLDRDKGVSNVLVGDMNLFDVVVKTEVPNLNAIACGPIPPNPSELLGSNAMVGMLGELSETYDRIIIDSPPLVAVTDAIVLSGVVDGTVLVLRANSTSKDVARTGVSHLKAVNANMLGIILNRVDLEKNAYYYKQNYYTYLYGEDTPEPRKRAWDKMRETGKRIKRKRKV